MKDKLVKESLNEFADPSGDPANNPVQKAIMELGDNPAKFAVVSYCWDNYSELTGWDDGDKWEESHFPEEIEALIDHYGFDYDDFSQEWGMYAEGESDRF